MSKIISSIVVVTFLLLAAGCSTTPGSSYMNCPRVVFLDGSGWCGSDNAVRKGFEEAGYPGRVEPFIWSIGMGPLPDHMLAGPDHARVTVLAERITQIRRADRDGQIVVMGYSAGTGIVVYALEKLPPDIMVDHVVLLSPSISGHTDLRDALLHVKGRIYYTKSKRDSLLAIGSSSGQDAGMPAGRMGFEPPEFMDDQSVELYSKVVQLPWMPEYADYGWDGGHMTVISSEFVRMVIAPRIMDYQPYLMDRPFKERKK